MPPKRVLFKFSSYHASVHIQIIYLANFILDSLLSLDCQNLGICLINCVIYQREAWHVPQ
jgi:hypothetical protein